MSSTPHAMSLDTFCSMVRSFGYEVALTVLPNTFRAERGNDIVVAEFNDNGICTLRKNGADVGLSDVLKHPDVLEVVEYLHQDGPYWILYRNGHFLSRHLNEADALANKAALEARN